MKGIGRILLWTFAAVGAVTFAVWVIYLITLVIGPGHV